MTQPSDAFAVRARARVGQTLCGKWRLDALLGIGGMAAVFAATHTNNGRHAAIKLLHTELSTAPEVRARFLREGYVANKIDHPGTVIILDDYAGDDGTVFLVMELLDGESLEARRERLGALNVLEVLSLADRLLDVLAAAHDKGIVHRDIKPENIYLTRDGSVKVLDFGIARILENASARLTLTSAGAIGTPAFMPQEQARGRWNDVGPRSDVWAVGATMFTLLTGRLVHVADTVNELMLAAMTKSPQTLLSVAPTLPPAVASVVDRALSYDVDGRWSDARSMQAAVRAAYATVQAARAPEARPSGSRPSGSRPDEGRAYGYERGGSGGATHEPVTIVGRLPSPPRFPVLPIVGAIAGALMMGVILLLVLQKPEAQPSIPAPSSASSSGPAIEATAAPTATSANSAPTTPTTSPTSTTSSSASAPSADPSASAKGGGKPVPKPPRRR